MKKEENTSPVVVTESFCQLEGHTDRITGLSWSSHHQGYLVSASYDWTAQVLNLLHIYLIVYSLYRYISLTVPHS